MTIFISLREFLSGLGILAIAVVGAFICVAITAFWFLPVVVPSFALLYVTQKPLRSFANSSCLGVIARELFSLAWFLAFMALGGLYAWKILFPLWRSWGWISY